MIVVGVDPGKEGGLAELWPDGIVHVYAMPVVPGRGGRDEYDVSTLCDFLARLGGLPTRPHVFIERLHPMPLKKGGTIANFNRGASTHLFIGLCAGLRIPYTLVLPQTWQKVMLAGTSGADTKQRSIVAAQRLFPSETFLRTEKSRKPHDGLTDAALIAEFGRRSLLGEQTLLREGARHRDQGTDEGSPLPRVPARKGAALAREQSR